MRAISFLQLCFLLLLAFTAPAYAEEPGESTELQVPAGNAATTPATPTHTEVGANGGDERNEALTVQLRDLVKRLDAADRNGKVFPLKNVETAIRAEFMRRAEGDNSISWLGKKKLKDADVAIAQDNLNFFLSYAKHLLQLTKSGKKLNKKEEEEMKLMAAKAVIDECNGTTKDAGRGIASLGSSQGLGPNGKAELQRRRRIEGGMVSGEDYRPLGAKKVDDIGKAYKAALAGAVKEYDAMAVAINKSTGGKPGKH